MGETCLKYFHFFSDSRSLQFCLGKHDGHIVLHLFSLFVFRSTKILSIVSYMWHRTCIVLNCRWLSIAQWVLESSNFLIWIEISVIQYSVAGDEDDDFICAEFIWMVMISLMIPMLLSWIPLIFVLGTIDRIII